MNGKGKRKQSGEKLRMAKKTKITKITERDKKYYRMGFEQGEHELKKTILLFQRTNKNLWRELLRLDRIVPVAGVVLTYAEVEKLARALRKKKASPYRASKLEEKIITAKREGKLFSFLTL